MLASSRMMKDHSSEELWFILLSGIDAEAVVAVPLFWLEDMLRMIFVVLFTGPRIYACCE
jgi:hypothetical protein